MARKNQLWRALVGGGLMVGTLALGAAIGLPLWSAVLLGVVAAGFAVVIQ